MSALHRSTGGDLWTFEGQLEQITREDGGTHAYTVLDSEPEWVTISSESQDGEHPVVEALAGHRVRVTIRIQD